MFEVETVSEQAGRTFWIWAGKQNKSKTSWGKGMTGGYIGRTEGSPQISQGFKAGPQFRDCFPFLRF